MLKPGDLSGGAAQTVNCSCTIVYISERFARRNYPEAFAGQPVQGVPTLPSSPFRIANSLDEAKLISKEIIERNTPIRVQNTIINNDLTLEQLNRANAQINKLTSEYNLSPHLKETSEITLLFNSSPSSYGFVESYPTRITKINFGHKYDLKQRLNGSIYSDENGKLRYAGKSQVDDINKEIATVTHEFAHVISSENKYIYRAFPQVESFWSEMTSLKRRYTTEANKLARSGNIDGLRNIYLGDYASRNKNEFMAEGFTEYKLKSNPSKYALEIGKLIDKYFKK